MRRDGGPERAGGGWQGAQAPSWQGGGLGEPLVSWGAGPPADGADRGRPGCADNFWLWIMNILCQATFQKDWARLQGGIIWGHWVFYFGDTDEWVAVGQP